MKYRLLGKTGKKTSDGFTNERGVTIQNCLTKKSFTVDYIKMAFSRNPRFTKYLVENDFFKDRPLTVVDVGARSGPELYWAPYGKAVRFIGFEPDSQECEKLNSSLDPDSKSKYYPVALHRDKGARTFYHQSPASSGFYPANTRITHRFGVDQYLKIYKTSIINTTDLDSFADEHQLPEIDFIKTDAEGGDFDILQGSVNQIKKSVLGISCEVLFSPWRGEGRSFSEVEQFLRPLGFRLYDLNLYRYAKNSFPGMGSVGPARSGEAPYGQLGLGQAIFFRDPVAEIENQKLLLSDWDELRVLKAASLFEVFRLPDCAIELIDTAFRRNIIINSEKINIEKFRDLITSGFMRHNMTYEGYIKKLAKIKKRGYINNLERFRPYLRKVPGLKKLRDLLRDSYYYFRSFRPLNKFRDQD